MCSYIAKRTQQLDDVTLGVRYMCNCKMCVEIERSIMGLDMEKVRCDMADRVTH